MSTAEHNPSVTPTKDLTFLLEVPHQSVLQRGASGLNGLE